jgi:transposase
VNKTYHVSLTETQTIFIRNSTKKGVLSTKKFTRMQTLLLSSQGQSDLQISLTVGRSIPSIERTRKVFVTEGFEAALGQKKRRGRPPTLTTAGQEVIVQLIKEQPPTGYARWTGSLVRLRIIELGIVKSISLSTIYRCLRARKIKLHQRKTWCLSKIDEKFVEQAEKVLEVYHRPYDKAFPVICFDEKSYELKANVRQPLPPAPGKPMREDNEWKRYGTVNIFMFCEPKKGWRYVKITKRRTKKDFARCMKQLTNVFYPKATKVTVVLDNLNTHTKQAIIDFYGEEEGTKIADKLEFVHTPIHGSWLNMAEIELSVLSSQSLNRRIPEKKILNREIRCWNKIRNKISEPINWKFSVEDLYELFEKIKSKQNQRANPSKF